LRRVSFDAWVERWERQQERYLVDREERFALMLDYAQVQLETAERACSICAAATARSVAACSSGSPRRA
jgi:hypothetical protein